MNTILGGATWLGTVALIRRRRATGSVRAWVIDGDDLVCDLATWMREPTRSPVQRLTIDLPGRAGALVFTGVLLLQEGPTPFGEHDRIWLDRTDIWHVFRPFTGQTIMITIQDTRGPEPARETLWLEEHDQ